MHVHGVYTRQLEVVLNKKHRSDFLSVGKWQVKFILNFIGSDNHMHSACVGGNLKGGFAP